MTHRYVADKESSTLALRSTIAMVSIAQFAVITRACCYSHE